MQALPDPPESLCVLDMSTQSDSKEEGEGGLYLNIGLQVNYKCLVSSSYHTSLIDNFQSRKSRRQYYSSSQQHSLPLIFFNKGYSKSQ